MTNFWKIFLAVFSVMLPLSRSVAMDRAVDENTVNDPPHIVFLISEDPDNYDAHLTIPVFAVQLEKTQGYQTTVLLGQGERHAYEFPGLDILEKADLVVVISRRLALPKKQMKLLQKFLKKGKPLVGIRTANHAFAVREGNIPSTHTDWWDFVPDILGCENRGYGPVGPGTEVHVVGDKDHPILQDITMSAWHSEGNLYLVAPLLDQNAEVLLEGRSDGKTEPIAWTRRAGKNKVFYTSLGYPSDFSNRQFQQLLTNGIAWALEK
jgi:type 1 glutamine amidotransferase